MKRAVGMACQRGTQAGKDKNDGKMYVRSFIHPYIFSQKSKDVGKGLCIITITFILPCLCTFLHLYTETK